MDNKEESGKIDPNENNEKNITQEELNKVIEEEEANIRAQEENIQYINHEVEDIEEESENAAEEENKNEPKEEKKERKPIELTSEEEQNHETENDQDSQELRPMDSKHKTKKIASEKRAQINKVTYNKTIEKKEIPRIMVFEKEFDLSDDEDSNTHNQSENIYPIDEEKIDTQKITKKEVVVKRHQGIAKGEYTFLGSEQKFTQREPFYSSVNISKEEIMTEINRRSQKEKKISYEVIDKYYSLTTFKNNSNIIDKKEIEADAAQEISKSILPEDNYSKYLLEQINKIRTEPQSFIGLIEDAKDNIKKSRGGTYYYNSNQTKVGLNEGEKAFDESIEFLKTLQPMPPLVFSKSLIPIPPQNKKEIYDINYLRKSVAGMMKNGLNVKSYWRDYINDPEICFLLMIVDDNGKNKGLRRKDILNPNMKYIGISSVEINEHYVNYFVLSS